MQLTKTAAPKTTPTLSVTKTDPSTCGGNGSLNFTFTNVTDGDYTITYDGGSFSAVEISANAATVSAAAGNYNNLQITMDGCTSDPGQNATLSDPNPPGTPDFSVTNNCDGTSTLTATSYDPSATLQWSTGESTTSISVDAAGDYWLTQTLNNCTSDATTKTAAPKTTPTLSVTKTDPSTCGGNGSLNFTFTNVTDGDYTITYDGGSFSAVEISANAATVSAAAGNYNNLQITMDGCTSDPGQNATLSDPNPPGTPDFSVTNNCDGTSTLTATSYDPSATLQWSTGESTTSISVDAAGDYWLTQTLNNCTSDATTKTAAPKTTPTLSVTKTDPSTCGGNGSLNFTFTNVTDGDYTITYDGGSFSAVEISANAATVSAAAGNYNNLQITMDGCTSDPGQNATLSDPNPPGTPDFSVTNNCDGTSTLTATSYDPSATLQWSTGESTTSISVDAAGDYWLTQTLNNCTSDATTKTAAPKTTPTLSVTKTDPSTCGGNGSLNFTFTNVTDGDYTITYDGGSFSAVEISANAATVSAAAGNYNNLQITVDGCTSDPGQNATLSDPNPPGTPDFSVTNNCDGTSTLTATSYDPSATLQWSTGESTTSISVDAAGDYWLTQTLNNCTSDATTKTAAPKTTPTLSVTKTDPSTCGGNGSLNFTFTNVTDGDYTITYDGGSFSAVEISANAATVSAAAGNYNNLQITVDGCTSDPGQNATLSDPNPPGTPDFSVTNNCDGTSTLTATSYDPSATLQWSTGESTTSISVDAAGDYWLTQTLNNCTSDATTKTAAPKTTPTLSVTKTDPSTCGGNGSLNFTFTNVTDGDYTITYDGGSFSAVEISANAATVSAAAGNYNNLQITVDGCTSDPGQNATLSDPNPPDAPNFSVTDNCDGTSTLTATLYETGATLEWSTGESSNSISVSAAGDYWLTQTLNNCTSDATTKTAAPKTTPTLSVTKTDPSICGGNGSLNFTFTNVTDGDYTITYDGGSFDNVTVSSGTASVTAATGTYNNLQITVNGCTSAPGINASLTDPTPPTAPTVAVQNNCGESVITASNYTGTLLWSTGETTESIVVTEPGTYTVTQMLNGCISDAASTIAAPKTVPTLAVTETDPVVCGETGSLDFTFTSVPDGTYTITYDAGVFSGVLVSGNTATVSAAAGAYNNLTITINDCTSASDVNASLADPNPPPAPAVSVQDNCGESVLTASNYTGTLLWSTGETTKSITVTTAGTYSITQTVNGCMSDAASEIAQPKPIPTLGVVENYPSECGGNGSLNFTFTDVPDGTYTINYDGGSFDNVTVSSGTASVTATAGTYNNLLITVDGCTSDPGINASLTDPTPPTAPTVAVQNNCGESVITASNYTGTLLWSTGETTESIIVTEPGTYTVTQMLNGCISDAASTIAAPKTVPTLAVTETDPVVCGETGSLDFTFTGVPDGTYTITYDAGVFSGVLVSGNTATVSAAAGAYNNLTITINDCTSASDVNASLADPNPPPAPAVSVQDNCGESVLTASNYTGTLLWSTGETTKSITVTTAGTYSITQTVNGCMSDAASEIAQPKPIPTLGVVENYPSECGGNGSLNFTFTDVPDGNYTISYDGGSFDNVTVSSGTASVTTEAGTYNNLQITVNGCTSDPGINASLNDPTPPTAPTVAVQNNCGESVITASNYTGTLLWSTGDTTESIVVTEPGTYSVTQMLNGCISDAASTTAAPKTVPTLAVTETDPVVCGETGSLGFTFTGVPDGTYIITYDAGVFSGVLVSANTATVSTAAGAYNNLTITVNDCTSASDVNASLADPNPPPAPAVSVQDNCGESVLTASNYTGTLLWSTGETTKSITVTTAGTYSITQTVNGCMSDAASEIAQPKPIPTLGVVENYPSECGGNGSLNFTFTDVPDGNYTISYDGGSFDNVTVSSGTASVTTEAGTYNNLQITVNGCTSDPGINASLNDPTPPPSPSIEVQDNCGESVITASNYTGTLLWSTGETTESIIVTEPGTYTVTQMLNGCISDAASTIAAPKTVPTLAVTETDPVVCGGNGSLDFTFTGVPDGTYTITYDVGVFSEVLVSANTATVSIAAGAYNNLTITINDCTSASDVNASLADPNPPPAPAVSVQDNCGESVLTASNYTGTLLWSTGETTKSITVTTAGTYSVTQTVNGCMSEVASGIATPQTGTLLPEIEVINNCGESTITMKNMEENAWFIWQYNNQTDSTQNSSIKVTAEGEYTFWQKNNNCKSLESTVTVSPHAIPSLPAANNQTSIVTDPDSITPLIAEASSDSYSVIVWFDNESGGEEVISPVLDTIGTITYYAEALNTSTGCISTGRTPVTLTIQMADTISIDTTIFGKPHNNVAVLIFATDSLQYQWFLNGEELLNATNQFYYIFESDRQNGNIFTIEVTFPDGHSSKFNYQYNKNKSLAAIDPGNKSGSTETETFFSIYPNPASSGFTIAIDTKQIQNIQNLTAKVFSISGVCTIEIPITQIPQSIDTENLRPGVYSVILYNNDQRLQAKKLLITQN